MRMDFYLVVFLKTIVSMRLRNVKQRRHSRADSNVTSSTDMLCCILRTKIHHGEVGYQDDMLGLFTYVRRNRQICLSLLVVPLFFAHLSREIHWCRNHAGRQSTKVYLINFSYHAETDWSRLLGSGTVRLPLSRFVSFIYVSAAVDSS
jgi:hypothetical protein